MAALSGFAKAVEIQFKDLDKHIQHMRHLNKRLYEGITQKIGKVLVNGPLGENRICHNLNISIEDIEGEAIMMMLDVFGITVATGSACASQGLAKLYSHGNR